MTQYYIIEISQNSTGEFSHQIHWAYDGDATTARLKAEAKYHQVLAEAAVSEYQSHSATLIASDGRAIMNQCYRHAVTPTPEPDPVDPEQEG